MTLAHVARPHVLAGLLPSAAYEVCVARDERYERLFGSRLAYGTTRIHSIPTEQFLRALEDGQPVYQPDSLRGYVEEDLQVIGKFDPDLVIGDFRLSLSISCRLAGKPYVSLANAYWSPYARPRYRVPELPIVKWMGYRLGQTAFDLIRPLAFAMHCRPLNVVRRKYGLPSLGHDLRQVYTDADHVFYADLPELVPTYGLPANHH
ncbi:MAG: glycosyl transferase family 1, partial [Thiobacillaceae bacterium]|nr:glycosyl transferase family 1 [Thiobacillaceae bacterium]